jgi:hypothetical protein
MLGKAAQNLYGAQAQQVPAAGAAAAPAGPPVRQGRPQRPGGGGFMSDAEIAEQQEAERLRQQWADGGLAVPTHRSAPAQPNGSKKAADSVRALTDSWGREEEVVHGGGGDEFLPGGSSNG